MPIPINSNLTPRTTGYALLDDGYICGGFKAVADATARDAIFAYNRKAGMAVLTVDDGKMWILDSNLTTWTEFTSGGGESVTISWPPSKTFAEVYAEITSYVTDNPNMRPIIDVGVTSEIPNFFPTNTTYTVPAGSWPLLNGCVWRGVMYYTGITIDSGAIISDGAGNCTLLLDGVVLVTSGSISQPNDYIYANFWKSGGISHNSNVEPTFPLMAANSSLWVYDQTSLFSFGSQPIFQTVTARAFSAAFIGTILPGYIYGPIIGGTGVGMVSLSADPTIYSNLPTTILSGTASFAANNPVCNPTAIPSSTSATVARAGGIRRNTTTGKLQLSNGSAWIDAGTVMASASNIQLTSTNPTTIVTFTPGAIGNYQISLYYRVITGLTRLTLTLSWTDSSGAQTYSILSATPQAVGSYTMSPLFINAVASPITLTATAVTANRIFISANIMGV